MLNIRLNFKYYLDFIFSYYILIFTLIILSFKGMFSFYFLFLNDCLNEWLEFY